MRERLFFPPLRFFSLFSPATGPQPVAWASGSHSYRDLLPLTALDSPRLCSGPSANTLPCRPASLRRCCRSLHKPSFGNYVIDMCTSVCECVCVWVCFLPSGSPAALALQHSLPLRELMVLPFSAGWTHDTELVGVTVRRGDPAEARSLRKDGCPPSPPPARPHDHSHARAPSQRI